MTGTLKRSHVWGTASGFLGILVGVNLATEFFSGMYAQTAVAVTILLAFFFILGMGGWSATGGDRRE